MTTTREAGWECTGYHQITDLTAATGIRGVGAAATLQAEAGAVRYRADGEDPTATTGMIISENETIWFNGDLSQLRFINDSGAVAKLNIQTFR